MRRFSFGTLTIVGVLALSLSPKMAKAQVILNLNTPINGAAPAGTLTATFSDAGTDTVLLTMSAAGLTGAQYVPVWLFNLTPGWNLAANPLTFNYQSGVRAQFAGASLNAYNGGSNVQAGLFDVEFEFETSNSGTPPEVRLAAGLTSVYSITGKGLNASSFAAASSADGGTPGGYYSAADVRAIPPSALSGSIGATGVAAVPEPSPIALSFVLGALAILGRFGRRVIRPTAA